MLDIATIEFTTSPVSCFFFRVSKYIIYFSRKTNKYFVTQVSEFCEKQEDNTQIDINHTRKSNQLKMGNCFGASGGSDDDVDQVRYRLKLNYNIHFYKAGLNFEESRIFSDVFLPVYLKSAATSLKASRNLDYPK